MMLVRYFPDSNREARICDESISGSEEILAKLPNCSSREDIDRRLVRLGWLRVSVWDLEGRPLAGLSLFYPENHCAEIEHMEILPGE